MKEQQHANSVKKILSSPEAALKEIKTSRISAHLNQSPTGHETDPKADTSIEKDTETSQQPERKAHQSVLHQFFTKKSSATTKESMCQDVPSSASSSTHEEVWTVKQQAVKAEIIATL